MPAKTKPIGGIGDIGGPSKPPGGGWDLDPSKLIKLPGKGGADGSITLPPGGTKPGRGAPDGPDAKPGRDAPDAPTGKPPVKDTPEGAPSRFGGALAGFGLAGAGIGAGVSGAVVSASNAAAVIAAGDATKKVAQTVGNIVENLTEFLSDPIVLVSAVGITALVILGPTIAASYRR
jgi:hypothetical protein